LGQALYTRTLPKGFYKVERDPVSDLKPADMLTAFFDANGGKAGFKDNQVKALETVLYGLDEIEAGQLVAARARVDAMLAAYPLSTGGWNNGYGYRGLNLGNPAGYYGVRMLDQILTLGNPSRKGKLRMTVVVAPTAVVTRPTLPNFDPETLQRNIAPEILADDARRLHMVTRLFRRWVQAITGGLEVELVVHVLDQGAVVTFNRYPGYITSYPDAGAMIDAVPASIADSTDLWWLVAPSGVPGDGSGFNTHFISGGMGRHNTGAPVFLSDDAWFTRKPEHMGSGPYSEVELRIYQPMWFQHEFMHHLFAIYPEFYPEVTGRQWFDRTTWPADFVGNGEPDYYAEALTKRLLGAPRTLAKALSKLTYADMSDYPVAKLVGTYEHVPRDNAWHDVTISLTDGNLRWNNAAPASWGLEVIGPNLWSATSAWYGAQKLRVVIDENGNVLSINNANDVYKRITPPANLRAARLTTNLASGSPLPTSSVTMPSPPVSGQSEAATGGEMPGIPCGGSCFHR
jgi:hypothetical protein